MSIRSLLLTTLVGTSAAVKLLVTSYNDGSDGAKGAIETLEFTPGLGEKANSATLKVTSKNQDCNSAPTWLDTSLGNNKLVCLDEGFAPPNATLVTLDIQGDGSLKKVKDTSTIVGPVTTKFYGDNKYVALSHFGPQGAISTFKVEADGGYTPLQNFTYNTTAGPQPEQANSHVHQAVLDPTGQYLVFPDLGADSVYVYGIDKSNGHLKEFEALKGKPGYGPRHLVFWAPGGSYSNSSTYMFVIHELSNKIVSYKVGYVEAGGLSFQEVHEVSTYGEFKLPEGSVPKAAEIAVSPDNFIIASNRNGTVAQVVNPDPTNSTMIPSDSIVTFKPTNEGKLEFVQLVPSGGSFPRHFALNKAGTLIAIANQNTFNLEIFERCTEKGVIGARVASAPGLGPGPITFVQWLE